MIMVPRVLLALAEPSWASVLQEREEASILLPSYSVDDLRHKVITHNTHMQWELLPMCRPTNIQTNRHTNGQDHLYVELLWQLKNIKKTNMKL